MPLDGKTLASFSIKLLDSFKYHLAVRMHFARYTNSWEMSQISTNVDRVNVIVLSVNVLNVNVLSVNDLTDRYRLSEIVI